MMRVRTISCAAKLTWKPVAGGVHEGRSGEALVGIVRPSAGGAEFAAIGVDMKNIPRASGRAANVYAGKLAVERAWRSWLRRARLQPIKQATRGAGPTHSIQSQ